MLFVLSFYLTFANANAMQTKSNLFVTSFFRSAIPQQCNAGKILVREGSSSSELFLVIRGRVELLSLSAKVVFPF